MNIYYFIIMWHISYPFSINKLTMAFPVNLFKTAYFPVLLTCFCFVEILKPVWDRKNRFYSILPLVSNGYYCIELCKGGSD